MVIALFASPDDALPVAKRFEAKGHACVMATDAIPEEADCIVSLGDRCPQALAEAAEESGMPVLRIPVKDAPAAAEAAAWGLCLADERYIEAARADARVKRLEDERYLEAARADARVKRLEDIRVKMAEQRTMELASANELLERKAADLKEALERLDGANRQLMDELNLASELQKSLLPRAYPSDVPLEFAHKFIPLNSIGGDFFDVVRLDEKTLGMIIADVSGHGVGPALVTAMFKSSYGLEGKSIRSPAGLMTALNSEMNGFLTTGHYVTAFTAIVDLESLEMKYCSAGHPNQLLVRSDGSHEELATMGFLLGMIEGMEYEEKSVALLPGDTVILFTDGVFESPDRNGNLFGREGILRAIAERRGSGPSELSAGLFSDLLSWGEGTEAQDDVTILMAQVLESL